MPVLENGPGQYARAAIGPGGICSFRLGSGGPGFRRPQEITLPDRRGVRGLAERHQRGRRPGLSRRLAAMAIVFVWEFLPETKNLAVEEIIGLFDKQGT